MDGEKGEKSAASETEAEALKKCLEKYKAEDNRHSICKSKLEAFHSTSSSPTKKPAGPFLKSGSLTDV